MLSATQFGAEASPSKVDVPEIFGPSQRVTLRRLSRGAGYYEFRRTGLRADVIPGSWEEVDLMICILNFRLPRESRGGISSVHWNSRWRFPDDEVSVG